MSKDQDDIAAGIEPRDDVDTKNLPPDQGDAGHAKPLDASGDDHGYDAEFDEEKD